jgi:hypothetical protein
MITSSMNHVALTCGCGRPCPESALTAAVATGKGHVVCSVCGARGSVRVLLALRDGREVCGRCGVLKCPDGCCCGC